MHRPLVARRSSVLLLFAGATLCAVPYSAAAQKTDWTSKLEPRTRAMQVCSLAGLNAFARDKKLKPRADRVQINASAEPKIDRALVTGSGAAVRSGSHWYQFSFTCTLNETGTKATAFTYDLGKEIPKAQWERLGLWQ